MKPKYDVNYFNTSDADLNYPGSTHSMTSSNSVYGNQVVGLVIGADPFPYQATVVIAESA
jgi:hypothetical protein